MFGIGVTSLFVVLVFAFKRRLHEIKKRNGIMYKYMQVVVKIVGRSFYKPTRTTSQDTKRCITCSESQWQKLASYSLVFPP